MKTTLRSTLPNPVPERLPSDDFPNCYMVRRGDFERVGGFDVDRFPQHMAEGDVARRLVRATDRQVYCVPEAKVWHFIETSFTRRLHLHDRRRAYWVGRSRVLYTALYASRMQWFVFIGFGNWVLITVYLWSLLSLSSRDRFGIATAFLRGAFAGVWAGIAARRHAPFGTGG